MNLKFSIRARILLLAIVPILLMGGGSAFLARYEMRQYAEKEFEVNTRQELALFASFVRNILEEAQNNAALLARNPAVIAGEGRFPTFRHSSEDTEYTRDMLSPERAPLRNSSSCCTKRTRAMRRCSARTLTAATSPRCPASQ